MRGLACVVIVVVSSSAALAAPPGEAASKDAARKLLDAVRDKKPDALRAAVAFPYFQHVDWCSSPIAAKDARAFAAAEKCLNYMQDAAVLTPEPRFDYFATAAGLSDEDFLKPHKKRLLGAKDHAFVRVKVGVFDQTGDYILVIAVGPEGKVRMVVGTQQIGE